MIEVIPFGKTGHLSTRVIFGGAAITERFTEQRAWELLEMLLSYGVNHIDTAPSYGNGNSETLIGTWMPKHRDRFFLATKVRERTYLEASQSIRESLKRLRTDYLDLIQLHNLTDSEGWETALGSQGALKACVEAREQGLVRFIGATGHGFSAPHMHMQSLERFSFDAVLVPWNYLMSKHPDYADGIARLVALCAQRHVAVQTIKSLARRPWAGRKRTSDPWYEPLTQREDITDAVCWLLSHEGIFLNSVSDAGILPVVLEVAGQPVIRPSTERMEAIVEGRQLQHIFSDRARSIRALRHRIESRINCAT